MTNFKFVKDLDDQIQQEMNTGVDNEMSDIRDKIDALISEASYGIAGDIIEKMNLEGLPIDPESVHDELFCEASDTLYKELGIY